MVHIATILSTTAIVATVAPSVVVAVPIQSTEDALVEREPLFPLLGLAAGAIGSIFKGRKRDLEDVEEMFSRSDSELIEREPEPIFPLLGLAAGAIGSIFKGRKREFADYTSEELDLISRAEPEALAELFERNPEPLFPLLGLAAGALGSVFKGRKRDLSDDLDVFERDYASPEYEDILTREFSDLLERGLVSEDELLELAERSPFLGKIIGKVGSFLGFGRGFEDVEDMELREVGDFEEFDMREFYEDEDVFAREWSEIDELD